MHAIRIFAVLAVVTMVLGCGAVGDKPVAVEETPAVENMRLTLEEHAESGAPLGSGGMIIEEGIEKIREEDPAKADALRSDYEELQAMQNPAQIKSKSQEMLSKL